jgi:hypothetical protein
MLAGLGALWFAACGSSPQPIVCKDIPAGGCPSESGAACQDPTCAAAYLCDESSGTWVLDQPCAAREGGAPDASSEAGASAEAASPRDASYIDAPPGASGGPGCAPLEPPDCTLGDALACPSGCCNCEDLFVCASGGWSHWGLCNASGVIVPDHP